MEENDVDLYICGHEHVFQHHKPAKVQHIVSGNSGSEKRSGGHTYGLYKGMHPTNQIDWFDKTNTHGFTAYCVDGDTMTVSFIDARNCEAFERLVLHKRSSSSSSTSSLSSTSFPKGP
jgi:hypothetical protein